MVINVTVHTWRQNTSLSSCANGKKILKSKKTARSEHPTYWWSGQAPSIILKTELWVADIENLSAAFSCASWIQIIHQIKRIQYKIWKHALLDKVRSCIHGNYDAKQSHLMFNRPLYGHKKGVSWLVQLHRIRSFHAPFHLFSQCFYIHVISTKASILWRYSAIAILAILPDVAEKYCHFRES